MTEFRGRTWTKSRVSEATWLRVFRADAATSQGGRCRYCTQPIDRTNMTGDHVVPRSAGGTTQRENIKAACFECNKTKGSLSEKRFLAVIKSPPPGSPIHILLAYARRRIWVRANRACERIERAVGRIAA